ncbi:MAG: hypothetical protein GF333_01260 [Candidatus Omnitrophica bacterium]|nr:hypothetical protein [Candidatus Omnitrophota bacterium]
MGKVYRPERAHRVFQSVMSEIRHFSGQTAQWMYSSFEEEEKAVDLYRRMFVDGLSRLREKDRRRAALIHRNAPRKTARVKTTTMFPC